MSNACSISKKKILAMIVALVMALTTGMVAIFFTADQVSAVEVGEGNFVANELSYNGTPQNAISNVDNVAAKYRLNYESNADGAVWTDSIPTVTEIGMYTVQIKVGEQIEELKVEVKSGTPAEGKNGIKLIDGDRYVIPAYLTYSGEKQPLINEIGALNEEEGFTSIEYSTDNSSWSQEVPNAYTVGQHTVYVRVINTVDETKSYSFECKAFIAKAERALSFAYDGENSVKYVEDEEDAEPYNFSVNGAEGSAVTYSVSNEDIATISNEEKDKGSLTINKKGKFGAVTITAEVEENDIYKAETIEYTLIVQAPKPTLRLVNGQDEIIDDPDNPTVFDYTLGKSEILNVIATKTYDTEDEGSIEFSYSILGSDSDLETIGINTENGTLTVDSYSLLANALLEDEDECITVTATVKKSAGLDDDGNIIYPEEERTYSVDITFADIPDEAYSISDSVEQKDDTKIRYYNGEGVTVRADDKYSVAAEESIGTFGADFTHSTPGAYNSKNPILFYIKNSDGAIGYKELTDIVIDIAAPVINNKNVKYIEKGGLNDEGTSKGNYTYFYEPVIKFTVEEENFDKSRVKLVIKDQDGNTVTVDGTADGFAWSEGDNNTHIATYGPGLEDGKYSVTITCSDRSDNKAADYISDKTIVVDRTKPEISVKFTEPKRTKNKVSYYSSKSFTCTITVKETNFHEEDFTFKVGNKEIELKDWAKKEDGVYTKTYTVSKDGDYVITGSHTDKSGNTADYKSNQKTIDTKITAPTIRINGANGDGRAYKNEVIPSITIDDPNYEKHDIKLTRTRYDERNVDVTSTFMGRGIPVNKNGGTGSFNTFDRIRENDGIYTLTVEYSDIVGHTSKEEITFTVNRFGSVYKFNDYLSAIIQDGGQYIKAVEEDLIITEYNPDRLVAESLNIEITRDGKPLENIKFTANLISSGSAGVGWYEYQYVIDKSNFDQDGIYKIDVSSADATGNTPENNNFDDKIINFKVDSTPPEITSIIGLEEARIKAKKHDVSYEVYDTIGLKSVEVYVNDKIDNKAITDFEADPNNYSGKFQLTEDKFKRQEVVIEVTDLAGNVTSTGADDFTSAYAFEDKVLVSTNALAQWFYNRPLFFGTLAGILIIAGALWYFLVGRRREDEEEEF